MGTIWMPDLSAFSGPKYQRLVSAIEQDILNEQLPHGRKLPPQRRLADALGVTIGTVTRAYALLSSGDMLKPALAMAPMSAVPHLQ